MGTPADLLETALHCLSAGNTGAQDAVVNGVRISPAGSPETTE